VPARETSVVDLPYSLDHAGMHELVLRLEDKNGKEIYRGRTTLRLGFLQEQGFGYRLAGLKGLPVWWYWCGIGCGWRA
jgi:hypothetical protein